MLRDIARYTVFHKKKEREKKLKGKPFVDSADHEYLMWKILIFRKHVRDINYNHLAGEGEEGERRRTKDENRWIVFRFVSFLPEFSLVDENAEEKERERKR